MHLKVDPPVRKTKGGLYLPAGNLQERLGQQTATVLAVGSGKLDKKGKKRIPPGVKKGDRIYMRGFLSEIHKTGGMLDKEHCLIHIDDVLGIVEDE